MRLIIAVDTLIHRDPAHAEALRVVNDWLNAEAAIGTEEGLKVVVDAVLRESGFDPLPMTNSELYADFHTLAMRAYQLGQLHAEVAPAAALSPTPTALERQLEYLRTALRENLGLSKDAPDEDIIDQSGEHSEWLKNYETCMTTIAEAAGVRLNGSELQWSDMTRDVVAKLQSVALSPSEEPKK